MAGKILILDTGREWGGGTNSLIELIKRLDRKSFDLSALFYNNYSMGGKTDVKGALTALGVEFIEMERGGKRPIIKGLKEAGRALLSFSDELKKKYVFQLDYIERILPDSERIAAVLKEGAYDLLYMNNQPSSNLEGILAAKALSLPCVQHSRVEVKLNRMEAESVNGCVDRVICVSKGVMDSLVESGVRPEKCVVVYNGIDPETGPQTSRAEVRKSLGIGSDALVVGTVGSLIKRKRVGILLEAVAAMKDVEGLVCVIAGDGPEMERLKKEAASLGVEQRVFFTGFSTDALSLTNAMDVFVMPSEKEGLPRVVLEAMLMATPVVGFDVVGTRELIENNATGVLLKDGGGGRAVADAVRRLARNPELMRSMGEAGRKKVTASFGMDRCVEGVSAILTGVLEARQGS